VLLLGSAQCSQNFDDGSINMAPSKQKKSKLWAPHELINMNHTTLSHNLMVIS
jgi:hypothetical protein